MKRLVPLLLLLSGPAFAAPSCPTEFQRGQLSGFADRVAASESPAAAKKLAMSKIRLSQQAVHQAARIVHDDQGIAAAEAKLDRLEAGVRDAQTQDEVAAQFRMDAQAMNCSYDTIEVVIIVIGFVLGIIPGILFLFLFC